MKTRWTECQFNEGVKCERGDCSKCGWNPAVAKRRVCTIKAKRAAGLTKGSGAGGISEVAGRGTAGE